MKIKILTVAFGLLFFGSIASTGFAQVVSTTNSTTVVDNHKDKKKNNKKATCKDKSCCDNMKSCKDKADSCGSANVKDSGAKDKKSTKGKK